MSDFRTVQEYLEHQEKALARLRWLQVTELAKKHPNNADLGAEVRKLTNK
jgi:hypothetical protein|tara:strand:+ start:186 stop:335 length:150 start_codon:yes stop_codon:yes gene_type:complete